MALAHNDNSTLFAEGVASTLRLIVYLTVAIALMVLDRRGGYLEILRMQASLVVEPVYRLAAWPAQAAYTAKVALTAHSRLAEENRQLREALLLTQARLNRADAVVAQNIRLQELLEMPKNWGLRVQLAKLIDIDLDPFRHRIVLDVGHLEGVSVGQPVIDAYGVMGQVVAVLPHTSTVTLITDANHAIPVVIDRTGLRTIAYGMGEAAQLILPNVAVSADIKVGDKLVTSGLGGRFPAGFPVGEVRQIKSDKRGMFVTALAVPSAALNRSGEVLLLQDVAEPYGPPVPAATVGPPVELAEFPANSSRVDHP